MAAKGTAALRFVLTIALGCAGIPAYASLPREQLVTPAIDRYALRAEDEQHADRAEGDNAQLLARACDDALPVFAPAESLSKTRVWGSDAETASIHREETPLSRALVRASAVAWRGIASDRTVLTPDPAGYQDSSNLYAFAGGDPVNGRDPSGNCINPFDERCRADMARAAKATLITMGDLGEAANKTFVQFNVGVVEGFVNIASAGQYNGVKQAIQQGKIRVPHSIAEANEVAQNANEAQLHGVVQFASLGTFDRSMRYLQEEGGSGWKQPGVALANGTGVEDIYVGGKRVANGDWEGAGQFAGGVSRLAGTAATVVGVSQALAPSGSRIVNLTPGDFATDGNARALSQARGVPIVRMNQIRAVGPNDTLTLVGHGEAGSPLIGGMHPEELASVLRANGLRAGQIELATCYGSCGAPALAQATGTSVLGAEGFVNAMAPQWGVPWVIMEYEGGESALVRPEVGFRRFP